MGKTLGAYYQAYDNLKATEFVLKNFRNVFPDSPIYLISDGGKDLSGLAKKYNCFYAYLNNLRGGPSGVGNDYYDTDTMLEAWRRHKLAVDACGTDYIMILEDDVWVTKPFFFDEDFHMRGGKVGSSYSLETRQLILSKGGKMHPQAVYGASGGAIYSSNTFLSIYDSVIEDIRKNESKYLSYVTDDGRNCYKQIAAIDCSLTFYFNLNGYTYEHADWHADVGRVDNWHKYPVIHSYKEYY